MGQEVLHEPELGIATLAAGENELFSIAGPVEMPYLSINKARFDFFRFPVSNIHDTDNVITVTSYPFAVW
jgi:hypothetical protein